MQGQYLKPGDMKGKRENSGSMAATNGQPASDDLFLTQVLPHPPPEVTLESHNFLANTVL